MQYACLDDPGAMERFKSVRRTVPDVEGLELADPIITHLNHPKGGAIAVSTEVSGFGVDLRIRTTVKIDDGEPWVGRVDTILDYVVKVACQRGSGKLARCRNDNRLGKEAVVEVVTCGRLRKRLAVGKRGK